MNNDWDIYLLRCCNGFYYVGHTKDLEKRISPHNSGKGAAYTEFVDAHGKTS